MTIKKQLYCWWLLHALVVEEENCVNKSQILYQKPIKPVTYYADKISLSNAFTKAKYVYGRSRWQCGLRHGSPTNGVTAGWLAGRQ